MQGQENSQHPAGKPTNCATRLRNQKEWGYLLAREEDKEVHVHSLTSQPERERNISVADISILDTENDPLQRTVS
jgi:hypothetical protein